MRAKQIGTSLEAINSIFLSLGEFYFINFAFFHQASIN